jgi:hypothetical protein
MVTNQVASAGTLENLTNIYMAPAEAFGALKERPTWFVPAALLVLASCAVALWYYSGVDVGWLLERSLDPSRITPEMRKAIGGGAGTVRYVTMGSSTIGAGLVLLAVFLINAGYLSLVSLMTNDGFNFKHWFSLVSWSSMPGLLSMLAILVNLAVSDISHLPQEHINPLSYASLFGLDLAPGTGTGTRTLASMDPTALWTLALMTTGYRLWTGKGIAASALIVAAPLLLFVLLVLAL